MTWFEDDSKGISEEIKNMPREQLKAELKAYEEEAKRRKFVRDNAARQTH
jgi:hypothetical protein